MNTKNVTACYIIVSTGKGDSSISYTWRNNSPDYFISLSNERTGFRANRMSLSFVYNPGVAGSADAGNKFESMILRAKGDIYLQYGWSEGARSSTKYQGLILGYTCDVKENYISYTVDVLANSILYNYNFSGVCTLSLRKEDDINKKISDFVNTYLGARPEYEEEGFVYDLPKDLALTLVNDFSMTTDQSPFEVLKELAKVLIDGKVGKDIQSKSQIFLDIDPDYKDTYKRHIRFIKPSSTKVSYSFYYNANPNKSYTDVISWSTEFNGTYSVFKVRGGENTAYQRTETAIDSTDPNSACIITYKSNAPIDQNSSLLTFDQDKMINDIKMINYDWNNEAYRYCYNATLKVRGITAAITLGTLIEVFIYVGGSLHHTSGKYIVKTVKDEVDQQGFTTTLSLYKSVTDISESVTSKIYVNGDLKEYSNYVNQLPKIKDRDHYIEMKE